MSTPGTPRNDRRAYRRLPPRGKPQAICLKGALGLGRNLAEGLVDVAEAGARLILTADLAPGQEVEVTLSSPCLVRPVRALANVIWSQPAGEGRYAVGVRFRKALNYEDFNRLI